MAYIRTFLASICLSLATATAGFAATIDDNILYDDLALDTVHDLAGFDITGGATGPASLSIRFGVWNSSSTIVDWALTLTFNGVALTPDATIFQAYFSGGIGNSITYDVSSLVGGGLNTLSAFATSTDTTTGSYAIGELSLDYTPAGMAAVPLPASLPLLGLSLVGFGLLGRRRRQG